MEWFDVAPVSELNEGEARVVDVDGVDVAVINIKGEFYALEDVCTHDGSPLIGCGLPLEEVLDGDQIICRVTVRAFAQEPVRPSLHPPMSLLPAFRSGCGTA